MSDDLADGALMDLCGLTLGDLSELSNERNESDETCMDEALSRILAVHEEVSHCHSFQSAI
jgi:hypothetical protein